MSMKGNLIALGVLGILGGAAILANLNTTTSTVQKDLTNGFAAFRSADLATVNRIAIKKAKEKDKGSVELRRKGDGWTIASAWDYPADKKKVQELLDELKKVRTGTISGSQRSSHQQFKVDDEKGIQVYLFDSKDQKLGRVVIGGDAPTRTLSSGTFVRFEDEDQVWEVEASLRNKVISYPEKVEA